MGSPIVDLEAVLAAAHLLDGVATRTPVLHSDEIDAAVGARVLLKAEQYQRSGSFKFRGAYNRLAGLDRSQRRRGVVAYSSGNHAQGVALAARLLGIPAKIVMPGDAPPEKRAATLELGAEIIEYDRYLEDREEIAARLAIAEDRTLIPPFDDPLVMAGQGTVALELLEDAGPLDALVVCVGGGGLLAGCGTAATSLCPGIRILGAEPIEGDDHRRSLAAGRRVSIGVPHTIADGQQLPEPGRLTWQVNEGLLDGVLVAGDDEIVAAMALLERTLGERVEPSGACALAALLFDEHDLSGSRVGVTLTGGNIDPSRFRALLANAGGARNPT